MSLPALILLLLAGRPEAIAANTEGFRAYQREEFDAALEFFKKSVAADDQYALGHYNLAATMARLDQQDHCKHLSPEIDVLAELKRAIELDPKRRARALVDADFKPLLSNLAFRRLLLQVDEKKSMKRLLEDTVFTSYSSWGSFGNGVSLRFLAGGKLQLGIRELKDEPFSNTMVDHPGSWTVEGLTVRVRMSRAADAKYSGEVKFAAEDDSLEFPVLGKLVNYLGGACDA